MGEETWGGIPIDGYSRCELLCGVSKANRLEINAYRFTLPVLPSRREATELTAGRNRLDLSGYHGILSFRLEAKDPDSHFWMSLK